MVENWPYWQPYDYGKGPEKMMVPEPPLRTVITNNTFEGANRFAFEGRGVEDDSVLVKGNRGTAFPSLSFG